MGKKNKNVRNSDITDTIRKYKCMNKHKICHCSSKKLTRIIFQKRGHIVMQYVSNAVHKYKMKRRNVVVFPQCQNPCIYAATAARDAK